MTWGEIKQQVEAQGVTDESRIAWIDISSSERAVHGPGYSAGAAASRRSRDCVGGLQLMAEHKDCGTCAFREGCVTFEQEPHNRLRGLVAVFSGLPFYCHYDREGRDRSSESLQGFTPETALAHRKQMRICQGWKRKVGELAQKGHFGDERRGIRRYLGSYALRMIQKFIDAEQGSEEKEEAIAELGKACQLIGLEVEDRGEDRTPA